MPICAECKQDQIRYIYIRNTKKMHIKIIIIILTLEQCFVHIIWTHGTAQGLLEEKQALSHKTKHKKREKVITFWAKVF